MFMIQEGDSPRDGIAAATALMTASLAASEAAFVMAARVSTDNSLVAEYNINLKEIRI